MKKAEENLKNHHLEAFGKNEKEIYEAKNNSNSLNDKLIVNIRELKKNVLERLYKNENKPLFSRRKRTSDNEEGDNQED